MKTDIKVEDEDQGESSDTVSSKKKKEKVFSEEKQKLLHTEKVSDSNSSENIESNSFILHPSFHIQINHIRNIHHINVHGPNTPNPIETFEQLVNDCAIPQQIVNNLISCGYKEPTPIQMQAIPIMCSVSIAY